MASIFWHAKVVVLIDCLQKSKTINGEYYANLLRQLGKAATKSNRVKAACKAGKRRPVSSDTIILLTSLWVQCPLCMTVDLNWLITLHILLVWHHLIIFCFLKHERHLAGNRYWTDYDVISDARDFFKIRRRTTGIQALRHRWKKCVDRRGDYVKR